MRRGRTKTTSFSLDDTTLRNLKALAKRRHGGNVSALIAEFAEREARLEAALTFCERFGVPAPSDEDIARIEAEWERAISKPKRKRGSGKAA